jgi:hypothetical protein
MGIFQLNFIANCQRLLKPLFFSAILLFGVCFGLGIAKAQQELLENPTWIRIGGAEPPPATVLTAIYFSDTLHGVVTYMRPEYDVLYGNYPPFVGDSEIWYTLNARRWFLASVPSTIGVIRAIRPIAGKLYAAVTGQDLIVSTDQGVTWQYSGLGLTDAYDIYADPSGKIRTLTGPMRQFARVDQMHCVAAGLNNAALISSDGGVTWNTLSIGDDTVGYSVYGDTCRHVFLYHNGEGSILRSSDYGVTWQNPLIGCGDYPETIVGSDEVVYVSTPQGFYRTIDDGYTYWSAIASVSYGPPVFSVCGPMGNDVATFGFPADGSGGPYNFYYICMTKDGGDYALRDPIDLADTLGNIVDTLEILSACPGLRIPVVFESGVDSVTTYMTVTQDSLSEFTLEGPPQLHFMANVPDTAWFDYTPHSMPETNTLSINFQNSWHCSSWPESRTIIVVSPQLASITMPSVISGNCSAVTASGSVTYLTPCQPLILTSVSSVIPSLTCTANFPDTVSGGSNIPFQFNPGSTSTNRTDTVEIKGHYLGTTTAFDTILTVALDGSATAPQLSSQNILDLGNISQCIGVKDSFAVYYNRGCVTDTITSIGMGGLAFTWLTSQLPIVVPPGDSIAIGYRFAIPDTLSPATFVFDTGLTYTGTANVNVVSNGDTETAILNITCSTAVPSGLPSISNGYVDCGDLSPCTGDTILSDTISNPGCDTIVISQMVFYNDSTFTLLSPANDTLVLPPGDSAVIQFEFAPRSQGEHDGVLALNSGIIGDDQTNDIGIPVVGFGVAGGKLLSANVQNVDIGSFYYCQESATRDTSVILYNTGCDSVTIDVPLSSNYQYKARSRFPFPFLIAPRDSAIVDIHFNLDTFSAYGLNGSITFLSDADTGAGAPPPEIISFTGNIIYPAKLHLSLSSPKDSAREGQLVTFYICVAGADSGAPVNSIRFDLTHNDDLLGFASDSGVSIERGTSINSIETDTIVWGSSSGLPASSVPDTIGSLTFRVYLTDSSATALALSNISFDDALGISPDCIASLDDSGSNFTYIFECGDGLIQDAMNRLPFSTISIIPNPSSSSITVTVSGVRGPGSGVDVEMFDLLGNSVLTQHSALSTQRLDVSLLPSGTYYLRLSQGGYVQSRQVVIER